LRCECQCGGEPRETDIEIGVKHTLLDGTTTITKTGTHTIGASYAVGDSGMTWMARHPGGQWVPLVPAPTTTG
jgi:hypothetical protein